jgi:hypothetical protein
MKWHDHLAFGLLLAGAFLVGRSMPLSAPELAAQGGRGPANPPPAPEPTEPPTSGAGGAPQVVYSEEGGQASAANGFLAVTGSYGVGTSVLYLIDTVSRQLAVYEAQGGTAGQRRIVLVGARKLDLDLQLEGYNDRSEYPYRRLKTLFEQRGQKGGSEVSTGLESGR